MLWQGCSVYYLLLSRTKKESVSGGGPTCLQSCWKNTSNKQWLWSQTVHQRPVELHSSPLTLGKSNGWVLRIKIPKGLWKGQRHSMPVELWQMLTTAPSLHMQFSVTSAHTLFTWNFYKWKEATLHSSGDWWSNYNGFQPFQFAYT